jgi:hypothetical protein
MNLLPSDSVTSQEIWIMNFNPLPLPFKALLRGQKDRVFFQQAFNL